MPCIPASPYGLRSAAAGCRADPHPKRDFKLHSRLATRGGVKCTDAQEGRAFCGTGISLQRPRRTFVRRGCLSGEGEARLESRRASASAQKGQRSPGRRALPERLAMRHWAPEEPLLWVLVWRDTSEDQLGRGRDPRGQNRTDGCRACPPSPGISAGGCYGTAPTPRLANPPRSRKDARERFPYGTDDVSDSAARSAPTCRRRSQSSNRTRTALAVHAQTAERAQPRLASALVPKFA